MISVRLQAGLRTGAGQLTAHRDGCQVCWLCKLNIVASDQNGAKTARDKETLFAPFLLHNPYYCGLYDDPRFTAQFRFVDIIRRKDNYWFVLFERA